jgi:hypothetical protein
MRFIHRIGLRANSERQRELQNLGVKLPESILLPGGKDPLLAFEVDENSPNWPKLQYLFQHWQASDVLRTEFSKKEIETARWLEIAAWHHGYPQPDEHVFGYRQVTYDLTEWCEQCGMGGKQKAPFQMKGEPRWGRNGILQLTWIYDELFVKPEVWSRVFDSRGIPYRPVIDSRGVELTTVVQVVIEEEVGVVLEGFPTESCAKCGRLKYLPIARGPFPALAEQPSRAVARTREYFGSGGQADKRIVVSQELARSLTTEKVRGAVLRPVGELAGMR